MGYGRRLRQLIHVKRLPDAVHVPNQLRGANAVAHPQTGQPINLREGAENNQRVASDQGQTVRPFRIFDEISVRLVQKNQNPLGKIFEKGEQFPFPDNGPGRVVWTAENERLLKALE